MERWRSWSVPVKRWCCLHKGRASLLGQSCGSLTTHISASTKPTCKLKWVVFKAQVHWNAGWGGGGGWVILPGISQAQPPLGPDKQVTKWGLWAQITLTLCQPARLQKSSRPTTLDVYKFYVHACGIYFSESWSTFLSCHVTENWATRTGVLSQLVRERTNLTPRQNTVRAHTKSPERLCASLRPVVKMPCGPQY